MMFLKNKQTSKQIINKQLNDMTPERQDQTEFQDAHATCIITDNQRELLTEEDDISEMGLCTIREVIISPYYLSLLPVFTAALQ